MVDGIGGEIQLECPRNTKVKIRVLVLVALVRCSHFKMFVDGSDLLT